MAIHILARCETNVVVGILELVCFLSILLKESLTLSDALVAYV